MNSFGTSWRDPRRALLLSLVLLLGLWLPIPFESRGHGAWDDWWITAAFDGRPTMGAISRDDPFRFADGHVEHLGLERGPMPWFTVPEFKVALWRPLTMLLHHLDHTTFGFTSLFARVHSLVWAAALVWAANRLFARTLGPRTAGLATVVFAIAGTHMEPVAWLCARNTLVSGALGILALELHVRAAESGRHRDLTPAVAVFAAALLGGEVALGALAYLGAYELTCRRESLVARGLRVSPYLLVTASWLAAYVLQGYGTHASGMYLNPLNDPGAFLRELPQRLLCLSAGALMSVPTAIWFFQPAARTAIALLGVVGLALIGWLLRPALRAPTSDARRVPAFFALGAVLSAIPQCAGLLGPRSLVVPSLGVSALVAACLLPQADAAGARLRWLSQGGRALLAMIHLVLAPLNWALMHHLCAKAFEGEDRALAQMDLAALHGKRVVVLAVADPVAAMYLPMRLGTENGVVPASWHALSFAPVPHRVRRTSEHELEVEQLAAPGPSFEQAFRGDDHPLATGARVELAFMQARVLEVQGRHRRRVSFTFRERLNDPALVFMAWKDGALRRVDLPPVGQALELPLEMGPWNLM